jgi:hypothetical protein
VSVHTLRSLFCDGDAKNVTCAGWFDHIGDLENVTEARKRARRSGWTRTNGKDLCPAHSAIEQGDGK